jgi:hypothetical protein
MNDDFKHYEEMYSERAAILEYCAGLPREKAEALARTEVETYMLHRNKVDSDKVEK